MVLCALRRGVGTGGPWLDGLKVNCTQTTRYTINCSNVSMVFILRALLVLTKKKKRKAVRQQQWPVKSALLFHFFVLFFGPSEWIRD